MVAGPLSYIRRFRGLNSTRRSPLCTSRSPLRRLRRSGTSCRNRARSPSSRTAKSRGRRSNRFSPSISARRGCACRQNSTSYRKNSISSRRRWGWRGCRFLPLLPRQAVQELLPPVFHCRRRCTCHQRCRCSFPSLLLYSHHCAGAGVGSVAVVNPTAEIMVRAGPLP